FRLQLSRRAHERAAEAARDAHGRVGLKDAPVDEVRVHARDRAVVVVRHDINSAIASRSFSSNQWPACPTSAFSRACGSLRVAGMTHETRASERIHLRHTCAHVARPWSRKGSICSGAGAFFTRPPAAYGSMTSVPEPPFP